MAEARVSPRRRVAALMCVAACGIAGCAGPDERATAGSDPTYEVGVIYHGSRSGEDWTQRGQLLGQVSELGIKHVRVGFPWPKFQPTRPNGLQPDATQAFADFMQLVVGQVNDQGLGVMGVLGLSPAWANGNRGTNTLPYNTTDYAAFAGWAAGHYAGQVESWEVWNAPNGKHGNYASAADYTQLLCAAHDAIKEANPSATVVSGGLAGLDWEYVREMYANGAADCMDVLGVHIYNRGHSPTEDLPPGPKQWLATMPVLRNVMLEDGSADTPIWITESGWSTSKDDPGLPPGRLGVTPEEQANYTVDFLRLLRERYPYVQKLFLYEAKDSTLSGDPLGSNYGLFTSELKAKPVASALGEYLLGANFRG